MNPRPLDPTLRDGLAQSIFDALTQAVPGSSALLRGSLAEGRANAYSDIDVLWEVPDDLFPDCIERIAGFIGAVHPLESLRSSPDFQYSDRRRLLFVQFANLPLFWRLDLDLFAQSVSRDPAYDVDNPDARGGDWSATHSALMNATAALKALLRDRPETAAELLGRGFARVGLAPPSGSPPEIILDLCSRIVKLTPPG